MARSIRVTIVNVGYRSTNYWVVSAGHWRLLADMGWPGTMGLMRANLRRIAVAPFANAARCAEQIGQDYVLSYRPSPADMVGYGFDRDRIQSILRRDLVACRESHVDITLKDVETVQADPDRVHNWVAVTREVIDEIF